jgi:hypothetical protein
MTRVIGRVPSVGVVVDFRIDVRVLAVICFAGCVSRMVTTVLIELLAGRFDSINSTTAWVSPIGLSR